MIFLINNDEFTSIYFGAQFCQRLIPALKAVIDIEKQVSRCNKDFTFVTPFVTYQGIKKLIPIFQYLNKYKKGTEVVFNDWGVFQILQSEYSYLKPVLGRLLTKQRRDPRASELLQNKLKSEYIVGPNGEKNKFIQRKTPKSLLKYFKGCIVNVKIFQKFLLENNIHRCEIDNLDWELHIKVDKKLKVSIYIQYGYATTTRLCGLINLTMKNCNKICESQIIQYKSPCCNNNFIIRGNTVFYQTKIPQIKYLKRNGIDRIIFQPEIPVL